MKLNIAKFLTGSLFLPVNVLKERANPYYLLALPTEASTKTKSDDDSFLKSSELMNLITKGLPNDTNVFVSKYMEILKQISKGLTPSTRDIQSLYSMIPQITFAAEEYKQARDIMKTRKAADEPALTSDGQGFIMTSLGLTSISLRDYDPRVHGPLATNMQLLYQRAIPHEHAFDTSLFTPVTNATSLEEVLKFFNEALSVIKETTDKTTTTTKLSNLGALGLDKLDGVSLKLLHASGLNGNTLIKAAINTTDNSQEIAKALLVLVNLLPDRMRNLLIARRIENSGENYDQALQFFSLTVAAAGAQRQKVNIDTSYTPISTKGLSGTGSGDRETKYNPNNLLALVIGEGTLTSVPFMQASSDQVDVGISVPGLSLPSLEDGNGKAITDILPLKEALNGDKGAGVIKYIDRENIYLGGNLKLDPNDLLRLNITYDGGAVYTLYMPVLNDGKTLDVEFLKTLKETINEIYNDNLSQVNSINARLQKAGISDKIEAKEVNGKITYSFKGPQKPYLLLYGYATDDVLGKKYHEDNLLFKYEYNNRWLSIGGESRNIKSIINQNSKGYFKDRGIFDWLFADDVYKFPIFIRYHEDAKQLVTTDAEGVKEPTVTFDDFATLRALTRIQDQNNSNFGDIDILEEEL